LYRDKIIYTPKKEKRQIRFSGFVHQVVPAGEVSNFLLEDFEAVLKFMNAEMQKKNRKI